MIMDLKNGKVDNGWILFSLVTGLAYRLLMEEDRGILNFIAGALLPLAVLGGLFYFRMLGAGDIKLFCALGATMGMEKIGKCILASFFIGACISLALLISNGNISQRFHYFFQYFQEFFRTGERKPYYQKGMTPVENFHFTVPVFLSIALYAGGIY